MKKKLEELYFEGFLSDHWQIDKENKKAYIKSTAGGFVFSNEVSNLENECYSVFFGAEGVWNVTEFQTAIKKWDELQSSPLIKALA